MWIETTGGYRVAVNGGVGLAEVFDQRQDIEFLKNKIDFLSTEKPTFPGD
jgi:hypothetical protein